MASWKIDHLICNVFPTANGHFPAFAMLVLPGPDRPACLNRRDLLYEKLNQIPGISIAVKPAGAMCPIGDEEKRWTKKHIIP